MATDVSMFDNPTLWVLVAFLMFLAVIIKVKLPSTIGKALDERAEKIKAQLDEARELKEEAQRLLATYQRKQRDASTEAEEMLAQARSEAENFAKEAEIKLTEVLERQAKAAEEKIVAAEVHAVKEVRTAAAQVAIKAASQVLAANLKAGKSVGLVDDAIKDLEKNFH